MAEFIVVEDDQQVYMQRFDEGEIPNLLESGFVSAILRINNDRIEYADLDNKTGSVIWKLPILKE